MIGRDGEPALVTKKVQYNIHESEELRIHKAKHTPEKANHQVHSHGWTFCPHPSALDATAVMKHQGHSNLGREGFI